uniref:Uncharacterized protein n=1 Tax=Arundo donax TaxID=35708 RepID=A0A0A9EET4_ARUDO
MDEYGWDTGSDVCYNMGQAKDCQFAESACPSKICSIMLFSDIIFILDKYIYYHRYLSTAQFNSWVKVCTSRLSQLAITTPWMIAFCLCFHWHQVCQQAPLYTFGTPLLEEAAVSLSS